MRSHLITFWGGPLDGELREVEGDGFKAPEVLQLPMEPRIDWSGTMPDEPVTIGVCEYRCERPKRLNKDGAIIYQFVKER